MMAVPAERSVRQGVTALSRRRSGARQKKRILREDAADAGKAPGEDQPKKREKRERYARYPSPPCQGGSRREMTPGSIFPPPR